MPTLPIERLPAAGAELPPVSAHRGVLDAVGATASIACAVHCAIVALALGLLPILGFMANPWIDIGFLGLSAVIGVASLVPSWWHHGERRPLQSFAVGLALLLVARINLPSPLVELALVLAGAAFVVRAHWLNRMLLKACRHAH
jgi:hypothetical protein